MPPVAQASTRRYRRTETIIDKDKWINIERLRWAKAFCVPICDEMPPNFPPLTLHVMRALCAIQHHDGHNQERIVKGLDALFQQYWVNQIPTHQPETLKGILTDIFGTQDAETSTSGMHTSNISLVWAC